MVTNNWKPSSFRYGNKALGKPPTFRPVAIAGMIPFAFKRGNTSSIIEVGIRASFLIYSV